MKSNLNIALVAHDGRKKELLEWVKYNAEILMGHNLYATGTTGKLIKELLLSLDDKSNFPNLSYPDSQEKMMKDYYNQKVKCLLSGPLGGDAEIAAMIAERKIDVLIFFCDNLIIQGHNSDVQGLSRLASLYNIPFATNRTTADMIITSPLFANENYDIIIPGCIQKYAERQLN